MPEDLTARVESLMPELIEMLDEFVRIPSVSAPGYPTEPLYESARFVADRFAAAGLEGVRLLELEGAHPAMFGEIPAPPGAPTVLLYAHHDVQPPGPAEDWNTAPFEPTIVDGRIYGRGSSDDKSGVVMHLGTIRAFDGRPPVGIKVIIEGEEEIGSAHLGDFLERYADLLAADVIVIGDSGNWRVGQPALTTSLRGLVACLVEVRTAAAPVHSGVFGGVFPDAIIAMSRLLATLHDDAGNVAIAGLVSGDADPLDMTEAEVREQMMTVPGLKQIGEGSLTGRMWAKPAVSVLAMDVPPIREAINQLVNVATAKVSMRIPPGQDTTAAMNALRNHLLDHAPWGVDVTVTPVEMGNAYELTTDGPAFEAWRDGMRAAWGVDPVEMGIGGSIPFVADFSERYPESTILLTGCGDPTSAFHAPNESQDLDDLAKSIIAQATAIRALAP